MAEDLRQKTISGMLWNSFQKFGCSILSFVSNIILARILIPEDFGAIGMLTIFIAVSETFVDGGFGAALIQRKNVQPIDYSTIFFWNLFIAVLFYLITFFTAPAIANFYHMPELKNLLRVLGLVVIINGIGVIQSTLLMKELKFRLLSKIYVLATVIGVIISIICAYSGWGVWSLIVKSLITSFVAVTLLWIWNKWLFPFKFSIKSLKRLFNFGSLMFLSKITTTLFDNLQALVIGRYYSASDLGYYSQARKLDEIPSSSLTQIVTQVSFPVFSKISEDITLLKAALKKNIICINFIIFPLQIVLILLSQDIIIFLFSSKWIESVIFFKILCIYSMFIGFNALNTNIYKAIGKSNIYLGIQFIKQTIGIILLIIGLFTGGIIGVALSVSVSGIIWWIVSAEVNKKIVNYGFMEQCKDVLPSAIISFISGLPILYIYHIVYMKPINAIVIYSIMYISIYICLSRYFNKMPYSEILNIIRNILNNRNQQRI